MSKLAGNKEDQGGTESHLVDGDELVEADQRIAVLVGQTAHEATNSQPTSHPFGTFQGNTATTDSKHGPHVKKRPVLFRAMLTTSLFSSAAERWKDERCTHEMST